MAKNKTMDPFTVEANNQFNNVIPLPPPPTMVGPLENYPGQPGPQQQNAYYPGPAPQYPGYPGPPQQYPVYPGPPQQYPAYPGPQPQNPTSTGPAVIQQSQHDTSTFISLPEIMEQNDMETLVKNMEFSEETIRLAFIRKVFCILLTQLLITALVVYGLMQYYDFLLFARDNLLLVIVPACSVYFTTFLCMICCEGPRRRVPYNYIFLLLFTLSLSVMMSLAISRFSYEEILFAAGVTFAIVLSLTLFAFQTKMDFTLLSGSLFSIFIALSLMGITVLATWYSNNLLYTTLCVIFICIYIVWDIQMIIGGDHRYAFSPEEYVFAALVLYVDIMYLFLKLLRYTR